MTILHWPWHLLLTPIPIPIPIHLVLVCSLLPLSSAGLLTSNRTAAVPAPCLPDQASALLQLKRSFTTTPYSGTALQSWRAGTDCCRWGGIRCHDSDGRVTTLDLAEQELESGELDPALFRLTSLKYLNLAYNDFNGSQLPSSGFQSLVKLTHLNLSTSNFSGQIPTAVQSLKKLVSLDLSTGFETTELSNDGYMVHTDVKNPQLMEPNLETLVANLRNLRELHLGFVDLSHGATQWCNALAISCPELRVLSLPYCGLSGPICSSLSSLHSLSVINLEYNKLSGPFPDFVTKFSNLTFLQLKRNHLQGWVSPRIFQHKKLVTLDLYHNLEISGHLPNFSFGSRLESLNVGKTNFSGIIPTSLSNLIYLKKLGLGASGFLGDLPSSLGNLESLSALEISGTGIIGSLPSWVANLTFLTTLEFYDCGLSGSIPSFIGNLVHLEKLSLCNCGFSGEIPSGVSNLTQLQILLLNSNNFIGTLELTFFKKMPNLIALDLSDNNLVVLDGEDNSSFTTIPKLEFLGLRGCNMSRFPNFLRGQDKINMLDLSDNKIHGSIPKWAWEIWSYLSMLILSRNIFTSVGYDSFLPVKIDFLDLSNNLFEGPIPIPQGSSIMLDYSNNRFSSVPTNFSSHLGDIGLFSVSRNNLSGNIPLSFCGGTTIKFLDLSYNNFNGSIPSCLMENANGLLSLDLKENKLTGEIPDNMDTGCSFEALDLSGNYIGGQLPRCLVQCKNLEFLDVGNNQISDTFPCWMSTLQVQVLALKSNRFFGQVGQSPAEERNACAFGSARIIDLSSNNFSGPLPQVEWLRKLKAMILPTMAVDYGVEPGDGHIYTYKYSVAVTYKGRSDTTIEEITWRVILDVSNNAFHGTIPEAIGELVLLFALNMSHNSLSGSIPPQLGNLTQLEVLDLSSNELSGTIPQELASLDSLTTLNLSDNKLVGSIPQSRHFSTFPNSSFLGNDHLCGPPLSKECIEKTIPNMVAHHTKKNSPDIVLFLFVGLGFGIGFAIAVVVAWGISMRKQS